MRKARIEDGTLVVDITCEYGDECATRKLCIPIEEMSKRATAETEAMEIIQVLKAVALELPDGRLKESASRLANRISMPELDAVAIEASIGRWADKKEAEATKQAEVMHYLKNCATLKGCWE